ncbi:YceI family protein [Gracilimonas mengyeensis]|uniref:Polyisoprenoid-binding protein YceI n=1 Tax=Gracilimonas mengyeensis TaxID=1302730 RepID=A0A521F9S3_9BACT|nr:YceI family protein [Gracilimonas mengyeensis]SMO92959.1 Polyisoprenoid-binding protein YceI [Gracilimonas mengyeensis]
MKVLNRITSILAIGIFAISTMAVAKFAATSWDIDKAHSAINFEVTHFFTPVNGTFESYNSTINFDPENLEESSINVEIDVSSINTRNERRDNHLRSADFFNAEKWPHITFTSNTIEKTGENEFVAKGTLTIKETEQEIELPFTLLGITDNPMKENTLVAGITASTMVNRGDYEVGTGDWASDTVIGDEVTVDLNLELNAEK